MTVCCQQEAVPLSPFVLAGPISGSEDNVRKNRGDKNLNVLKAFITAFHLNTGQIVAKLTLEGLS